MTIKRGGGGKYLFLFLIKLPLMQDTQAALFSVGEKILPVELGADFAQRFGFYS